MVSDHSEEIQTHLPMELRVSVFVLKTLYPKGETQGCGSFKQHSSLLLFK